MQLVNDAGGIRAEAVCSSVGSMESDKSLCPSQGPLGFI